MQQFFVEPAEKESHLPWLLAGNRAEAEAVLYSGPTEGPNRFQQPSNNIVKAADSKGKRGP